VTTRRWPWALAGLLAGLAGLATSYLMSTWLNLRGNPVTQVAEEIIRITPGKVAEAAIQAVGHKDKPLLVTGVLVVVLIAFAGFGLLARRSPAAGVGGFVVLGVIGLIAQQSQFNPPPTGILPVVVGCFTWVACLSALAAQLRPQPFRDIDPQRRFVVGASLVGVGSVALGLLGWKVGGRLRAVDQARASLRIPALDPTPAAPAGAQLAVKGISPWQTPNNRFYRIDTSLSPPAIAPQDWSLRIHGMVDHPVTLTFADLLARKRTDAWVTLNCVSNTVGGPLIGNARWSGVRLKDLLDEVGVQSGADAIKQTSDDGWTCGTPLAALTDGRDAMLAIAMNGEALPIEHGFPVRTIVPGLYGYVSACKWVRDIEVTTYSTFTAYWTDRGWSAMGPVKLASRIDVPRSGDGVAAGKVAVGGVAWQQDVGIKAVDVQLDGGAWQPATLSRVDLKDAWVQWVATLDVAKGDHTVRVRATNRLGEVQTAARAAPAPNGATGWDAVSFSAH
jgi:DMSO/TMAO reductase YedYZ molybdopterin-dependent catalytic subunit